MSDEPEPLFELPPRFAVSKREQKVYSAAGLKAKRPDIYRAVVVLSGYGLGQLAIAAALSVSHHLVARVQEIEGCEIAIEKKARSRMSKRLAALADERLMERLEDPDDCADIPARDLSTIARNAGQMASELDGEATVRVDVRVSAVPRHEALQAHIASLRSASAMGSGGEKMAAGKARSVATVAVEGSGLGASGGTSAEADRDGE